MRQRVMIAMGIIARPKLLIADEPTTALDVTTQAHVLELLQQINRQTGTAVLLISHDLGVINRICSRVLVMYAGKIVEVGNVNEIFYEPKHPYTWALLSSIPDVDSKEKLESIPGAPPNMIYPPQGDAFAARNRYAMNIDFREQPPFFKITETHSAATWLEDPRAPKMEMPKIVSERIRISLEDKNE
jgi:oligopeptide/dipeptide ABC transporter ATP-binding protein